MADLFTRLVIGMPEAALPIFKCEKRRGDGWPVRVANDVLADTLPAGYIKLDFLHSCDVLGRLTRRTETSEHILRDQWQKEGWSEAKMQRALSDMQKAESHRFYGLRDDLREKIASTVQSHGLLFLFVYETWDGGATIKERIVATPDQVLSDSSIMQLNRLVEVREA